jgi:hypothetical protein
LVVQSKRKDAVLHPKPHAKKNKNFAGLLREQVLSYVYTNKNFHQRGTFIMSGKNEKINNIEMVEGTSNTTPQASLHLVNKFFEQTGLLRLIDSVIGARKSRGASDSDHVKAMVMSQIIGNDTIEDLKNLSERVEPLGVTVPSVSAARDFARIFHDNPVDLVF